MTLPPSIESGSDANVEEMLAAFWLAAKDYYRTADQYLELIAVEGLRQHQNGARETSAVKAVKWTVVKATLPFVAPPLAAMVKLQYHSGARRRVVQPATVRHRPFVAPLDLPPRAPQDRAPRARSGDSIRPQGAQGPAAAAQGP